MIFAIMANGCEMRLRGVLGILPKSDPSERHGGGEATVIAWLGLRTVTCPNPNCGVTDAIDK